MSVIRTVTMWIGTLTLLLIMSKIKAVKAVEVWAVKNTQPAATFTEDKVSLKPEDMFRIKSFLQSMNRYNEFTAPIKDTSSYCRSFDNCFECVKSLWFPCGWCHDYGCTDSPEHKCPFAEIKAEKSNITGEIKACPHAEHEGPIVVPGGVRTKIKVKLYVPDPALYDKEIICQIRVGDRTTNLKGRILNDVVQCYPVMLHSHARLYGDLDRGYLTLIWGGAQPYSNHIPLIVYNCELLANYCEACRKIPAEYGCGWCDPIGKCVIEEKCPNSSLKWTLNRLSCNHSKKMIYV